MTARTVFFIHQVLDFSGPYFTSFNQNVKRDRAYRPVKFEGDGYPLLSFLH